MGNRGRWKLLAPLVALLGVSLATGGCAALNGTPGADLRTDGIGQAQGQLPLADKRAAGKQDGFIKAKYQQPAPAGGPGVIASLPGGGAPPKGDTSVLPVVPHGPGP